MKINHLLEYPQDVAANSPLARAKARDDAKPSPALSDFGTAGANRASGQGTMPAQPAQNAVPAVQAQPATTPAQPETSTADLQRLAGNQPKPADVSNPNYKAPGTDMTADPADAPAGVTPNVPATTEPAQQAVAQKPSFKDKIKSAWDYANTDQSGADAVEKAKRLGDAGAAVSQGATSVAGGVANFAGNTAKAVQPGLSQAAQSAGTLAKDVGGAANDVGAGIQGVGQGVEKAGSGIGSALGGVGHVVRGLGNVAGEIGKGVGQTLTAPIGGLVHGYKQAAGGGKFGQAMSNLAGTGGSSGSGRSSGGAGGNDELANLQSTIQAMDQRMRAKGI